MAVAELARRTATYVAVATSLWLDKIPYSVIIHKSVRAICSFISIHSLFFAHYHFSADTSFLKKGDLNETEDDLLLFHHRSSLTPRSQAARIAIRHRHDHHPIHQSRRTSGRGADLGRLMKIMIKKGVNHELSLESKMGTNNSWRVHSVIWIVYSISHHYAVG